MSTSRPVFASTRLFIFTGCLVHQNFSSTKKAFLSVCFLLYPNAQSSLEGSRCSVNTTEWKKGGPAFFMFNTRAVLLG
jgi:hypothetical protein